MAYNKGLKYNDQTFNFAIALTGTVAPTTSTEGVLGQPFFVIANNKIAGMYVCTNIVDTTYAWDKVALDENSIKYVVQTLTDAQKEQARTNIGAGTSNFSGSYNDLTDKPTIPDVSGKLDKEQGAGNAGKFLVVGADGNVTTKTMSEWAGGSY